MRTKNNISCWHRILSLLVLLSGLCPTTGLSAQGNYVRTYVPRDKLLPGSTLNTENSMVSTSYYDAAGRLVQTVRHGYTPGKKDFANLIIYDGLGNRTREWDYLPFNESDGNYKEESRFNTSARAGHHFVDYQYEASAYHRLSGETGRNSTNKKIRREYLFNTNSIAELSVLQFEASSCERLQRKSKYPDGTLSCVKTTDEDGNVGYVFSDSENRVVLERRLNGRYYDTYYIYNDWNQLVMVLPPALIDDLPATDHISVSSHSVFSQFAYLYKYDRLNHRVGCKLPGADWHYTVYDGDHRPVFKQNARQRQSNEWTFFKYDGLGRIIMEGVVHDAPYDILIPRYSDRIVKEDYIGTASGNRFGYSENTEYSSTPVATKVYYYDTYDFLSLPLFEENLGAAPRTWEYPGASLQTGSYVSALEEPDEFELHAFYYDHRGRNTRTDKYNSISHTDTRTHQRYNFNDAVTETNDYWETPADECRRILSCSYDHAGRKGGYAYLIQRAPLSHHSSSETWGTTEVCDYDEFGRLSRKSLLDNKDTIYYTYDSRSRLEQIRNRNFSEQLYYDAAPGAFLIHNRQGYHNGQISGIRIRQGKSSYAYRLEYDPLNRLKESQMHRVLGDTVIQYGLSGYSEKFGYDLMGNICSLYQTAQGRVVNDLHISHTGNQILRVSKNSEYTPPVDCSHMSCGDYFNADGYSYDVDGNETRNLACGIHYSRFNNLNLPDSVLFDKSGNTTQMTYMADGKRVRTVHKTYNTGLSYLLDDVRELGDPIHTAEEIRDGDLTLQGNGIARMEIPGGYFTFGVSPGKYLKGYYFVTDHLGSIRTTAGVTDSCYVVQQLEYTPGGAVWRSFDRHALQPRHFCGKEELTVHGYNMYDSGRRFHTNNGIRFVSPDPLAEKYYSWSPYAYCFGNPVNTIDPDGRQGIPLPMPVPPLPIYYNPSASKYSNQGIVTAINKGVKNSINTIENGLILSAAATYLVFENTKQAITPEYKHQRGRDRRNKERLDLNQANVAKSIDANISGNMPNGDPAPKRGPQGLGKSVLIIGGAVAIIEDWNKNVLNDQTQSNVPEKNSSNKTINEEILEKKIEENSIILTPITNSLDEIFNKQW